MLRYVTLRYTTLHYATLRYTTLHYITLHYTPITHKRIIFHINKPSLSKQKSVMTHAQKPCLYRDVQSTASRNISRQPIRWFIPNKNKILHALASNSNDIIILNYWQLTIVGPTYHTQDLAKIVNVSFELKQLSKCERNILCYHTFPQRLFWTSRSINDYTHHKLCDWISKPLTNVNDVNGVSKHVSINRRQQKL